MSRLAQRVANKDQEMDRPSRGVGDCRQIASPPRRCKATPSTSTAINLLGIGSKLNNAVLLIVAPNESKVRSEVVDLPRARKAGAAESRG
jgi:hypothetical protein